jgi:hypothetical protein
MVLDKKRDHLNILIFVQFRSLVLDKMEYLNHMPLTEMSTRNIKIIMFLGSKVRLVRKADNLTAICEPTV